MHLQQLFPAPLPDLLEAPSLVEMQLKILAPPSQRWGGIFTDLVNH